MDPAIKVVLFRITDILYRTSIPNANAEKANIIIIIRLNAANLPPPQYLLVLFSKFRGIC